jgi:hypothetical protein
MALFTPHPRHTEGNNTSTLKVSAVVGECTCMLEEVGSSRSHAGLMFLMATVILFQRDFKRNEGAIEDVEEAAQWLRSHEYFREADQLDLHLNQYRLPTKKPA